jgi:hypothetical protein
MRRHPLLMGSLAMFALGILCQLYSMFNPDEPYMQQMSFMFVAMPSVLAIINHYYYYSVPCQPQSEENTTPTALPPRKRTPSKNTASHVADTSHHAALSEYTDIPLNGKP